MLVFQGAVAAGSAAWGAVAAREGVGNALLWAGVGAIASSALGLFLRLPDTTVDLTPWNHWRLPAIIPTEVENSAPVLVTVEYRVTADRVTDFIEAMHRYGRIRHRDGASRWAICRDLETPGVYVETFVVSSWAEHLRQHDRVTRADRQLEERISGCVTSEPRVRHLLFL
jgi:hypothetical protein